MRINNNIMVDNILSNLQRNMNKLDSLNQKLASGKKFKHPSQAPIRVADSMRLDSIIKNDEQYKKNIAEARNWLTASEDNIASGVKLLQRANELAIYGANDSLNAADRQSLAEEVKQLRNELVSIANSKLGDRYLFSGQATKTKPMVKSSDPGNYVKYQGDNNFLTRSLNNGIKININVTAEEVFKEGIESINKLYQKLDGNENADIISASIKELDQIIDITIKIRASIGARLERLNMTENRIEDEVINLKKIRSQNEDIDIAEIITDLKMQENVYKASLTTGARVMQMSLVDFIK